MFPEPENLKAIPITGDSFQPYLVLPLWERRCVRFKIQIQFFEFRPYLFYLNCFFKDFGGRRLRVCHQYQRAGLVDGPRAVSGLRFKNVTCTINYTGVHIVLIAVTV